MPRLMGVDIPSEKQTVFSLQYLYGVGARVARELCHKAGVDPRGKARDLHEDELAAGFQLLFHTLEFFGLCRSCQERRSG